MFDFTKIGSPSDNWVTRKAIAKRQNGIPQIDTRAKQYQYDSIKTTHILPKLSPCRICQNASTLQRGRTVQISVLYTIGRSTNSNKSKLTEQRKWVKRRLRQNTGRPVSRSKKCSHGGNFRWDQNSHLWNSRCWFHFRSRRGCFRQKFCS